MKKCSSLYTFFFCWGKITELKKKLVAADDMNKTNEDLKKSIEELKNVVSLLQREIVSSFFNCFILKDDWDVI